MRLLLEAMAKQGKSWLASSAPKPLLFLDFEHRAKYVPGGDEATFWDGSSDPMKMAPSSSRIYIHEAEDLNRYAQAMQWLRAGKHPFRTVVLDSCMELRFRLLFSKFPNIESIEGKDIGTINRLLEQSVKDILNLTKLPNNKCDCVILINGTIVDDYSKKIKPLGLGSVSQMLVHWVDVVAYLDNNSGRRLWLGDRADQDLLVGDGTNQLITKTGASILNPDITKLYELLNKEDAVV